jgi:hypothetical protein
MSEAFLHYIWQHQLFDKRNLVASDNSVIEIISPGVYNTSAGPDFFNSQIKIGDTRWAGNVEIHMLSSDWYKHNHQVDAAYDNCILHVVYHNDSPVYRMNGSEIQTIELRGRFADHLWENYLRLISMHGWIACEDRLNEIGSFTWSKTIHRMITDRLEQRANQILISLNGNNGDWYETFYQYLARNFGFQLNGMPFEMLARSLPFNIIAGHRNSINDIEALLFGQAGMLAGDFEDAYPRMLQNRYAGFRSTVDLTAIPFTSWKFLRLRPVNFPSVRIAQFAALLHKDVYLFDQLVNINTAKELLIKLQATASGYWDTHYRFDTPSSAAIKKIGKLSAQNIIINTCVPLMYAWSKVMQRKDTRKRSIEILKQISAEENHVIDRWKDIGIKVNNAVESQALLQLKISHCSEKKCLTCSIGKRLINT